MGVPQERWNLRYYLGNDGTGGIRLRTSLRCLNRQLIWLVLSIVLTAPSCVAADRASLLRSKASNQVDCLVLKQRDEKIGQLTVYLSKDFARVDLMNGQATIVAKAPSWNVSIRNRDKKVVRVTQDIWHQKGLHPLVNDKRKFVKKPGGQLRKTIWHGRPAVTFSRKGKTEDSQMEVAFQIREKKKNSERMIVTYVASSNLGLSRAASAFSEGLYLMPPGASVLLESNAAINNCMEHRFTTRSIEKTRVPISITDEPAGLTRAASVTEVLVGKGMEEMMLNFSGSKQPN